MMEYIASYAARMRTPYREGGSIDPEGRNACGRTPLLVTRIYLIVD